MFLLSIALATVFSNVIYNYHYSTEDSNIQVSLLSTEDRNIKVLLLSTEDYTST